MEREGGRYCPCCNGGVLAGSQLQQSLNSAATLLLGTGYWPPLPDSKWKKSVIRSVLARQLFVLDHRRGAYLSELPRQHQLNEQCG